MTDVPHTGVQAGTLRLTAAQQGVWFAQRLDPADPAYNIAEYADIKGPVDPDLLRRAVGHTAAETEALSPFQPAAIRTAVAARAVLDCSGVFGVQPLRGLEQVHGQF
ncbi:condensation domain-containing protein [Streptomyces sp. NPDC054995]